MIGHAPGPGGRSARTGLGLLAMAMLTGLLGVAPVVAAAGDVGFQDMSTSGVSAPTGQKPESKLWYTSDGWFGLLWSSSRNQWRIHRFNWSSDTWTDTGVVVDSRAKAEGDALWDISSQKLYISMHIKEGASTSDMSAKLYRFSYAAGSFSPDAGYPIALTSGAIEALVIDRDTTGLIWGTWTVASGTGRKVVVTHATSSANQAFVTPFTPQVSGSGNLDKDDISTLVAYDGKIGVMWSNQNADTVYFASHVDGASDSEWQLNPALSGPKWADDHLNIKSLSADPAGRVFAAVKTSLNDVNPSNSNQPLILLLVLDGNGTWKRTTVDRIVDGNQTRPIVLVSPDTRRVYVFAAGPCCSGGVVYTKSADLDNPSFPTGNGDPFIKLANDSTINNPSSTKQPVTAASGLLVIAADDHSHFYVHNKLTIGGGGGPDTTPPTVSLTAPADGASVSGPTTISADAFDNVGVTHVDFSVNGNVVATDSSAPYSTNADFSGTPEGSATVGAQAFDAAGNLSTLATRTVNVDHTPPDTSITQHPADPSTSSSAVFAFTSTESGTFLCSLDGAGPTSCTSPATYSGLANGSHTFSVQAIDTAGNPDPTPASFTWLVNATSTSLFEDGFESGDLSLWTSVTIAADGTAGVQGTTVKTGSWAARLSETATSGSKAYVRKSFNASVLDLTISGNFFLQTEGASGGNVPIFRLFDPSGVRLASVYRQNQASDAVYVSWTANGTTVRLAGGKLPLQTWKAMKLHVNVNGASSTVELWIDGSLVSSSTTASLGTTGVRTIQLGNDTSGQAFALVADDILVQ